jgi:1-deoxy-D-xylulose-5-phosphate reductoisomerase
MRSCIAEETLEASGRDGLLREPQSIDDALSIDHVSRSLARELLPEIAAKAS